LTSSTQAVASEISLNLEPPAMRLGEPAWAVATLFPNQGQWSEEDYFRLEAERYVELANGSIELPPLPTLFHAAIAFWFANQLTKWLETSRVGQAFLAPVPFKLFKGTIREPDIFVIPRQQTSALPSYPVAALLVMEVVSEGAEARKRDYVDKRADYAKAAIPEYWIIDPMEKSVTVLKLEGTEYVVHGRFEGSQIASSATFTGFEVDCGQIWALETQV
jgi:Uma2 family endonuclease